MPEKLAVDDVGGDRLAIDRDQWTAGTEARCVDSVGEGFLARARLADDEDRQPVACGLGCDGQHGAKVGGGTDQLFERQVGRKLFGDWSKLSGRPSPIGVGGKGLGQPFGHDRPAQEIGCAGAHCLDGVGNGFTVSDDDDREFFAGRAKRGNRGRTGVGIPAADQRGLHFAAVRPLQQAHGSFRACCADHAPAGAAGDSRHQPPFVGVRFQ